jgi:hypothetical protein
MCINQVPIEQKYREIPTNCDKKRETLCAVCKNLPKTESQLQSAIEFYCCKGYSKITGHDALASLSQNLLGFSAN